MQSFLNALKGLSAAIRNERHMRVHLILSLLTICLGFYYELILWEWVAILICIGMVVSLEIINTAIEEVCDFIHRDHHPKIGLIKDLSAGAVLMISFISLLVGLLIFLPKVF